MKESDLIPKFVSQTFGKSTIYKTFKDSLKNHTWFHYLFHSTVCFFKDNICGEYEIFTPEDWLDHHKHFQENY